MRTKEEAISFYKQGEFTDLCAGPHLMATGNLKAVKLTNATAAYWRGAIPITNPYSVYMVLLSQKQQNWKTIWRVEEDQKR